jgi:hypothetical protein
MRIVLSIAIGVGCFINSYGPYGQQMSSRELFILCILSVMVAFLTFGALYDPHSSSSS